MSRRAASSPATAPEQIEPVDAAIARDGLEHEAALEPVLELALARVLVGAGLEVAAVREEQRVGDPRADRDRGAAVRGGRLVAEHVDVDRQRLLHVTADL